MKKVNIIQLLINFIFFLENVYGQEGQIIVVNKNKSKCCGGVILGSRKIMLNFLCYQKMETEDLLLYTYDFAPTMKNPTAVKKVKFYKIETPENLDNQALAVLILDRSVRQIKFAKLSTKIYKAPAPGAEIIANGFDTIVRIINKQELDKIHFKTLVVTSCRPEKIPKGSSYVFCVYDNSEESDCSADLGGPLFVLYKGTCILIGMTYNFNGNLKCTKNNPVYATFLSKNVIDLILKSN